MRASTTAVVATDGRLTDLRCQPPLTLRRVQHDGAGCALCLVGTAAGPLPGDDLALHLHLEPQARAVLSATGASIAQGAGPVAALSMSANLGDGADLVADPGPLIVCAGSRVDVAVHLDLAATASVRWRELVVLGRTTDAATGSANVRWDVVRSGRPVLRQRVALGAGDGWATGGHRVLASTFVTSPRLAARTAVHGATAVAQAIDEHTVLVTVLADGAADANRRLDALLAALEPAART